MKTRGTVEVKAPPFFSSTSERDKSLSRSGRFTPEEGTPGSRWIGGWVGPRTGLEAVGKRKSYNVGN
jgi:hypothetical protein